MRIFFRWNSLGKGVVAVKRNLAWVFYVYSCPSVQIFMRNSKIHMFRREQWMYKFFMLYHLQRTAFVCNLIFFRRSKRTVSTKKKHTGERNIFPFCTTNLSWLPRRGNKNGHSFYIRRWNSVFFFVNFYLLPLSFLLLVFFFF